MLENSTKLISTILSSSSLSSKLPSSSSSSEPVRTRVMINAIYIAGVAFMVGIFLILLWVNLCSRHCWCWHDTSVVNGFNRAWIIRRSMATNTDSSSSKVRQQQRAFDEDELE